MGINARSLFFADGDLDAVQIEEGDHQHAIMERMIKASNVIASGYGGHSKRLMPAIITQTRASSDTRSKRKTSG